MINADQILQMLKGYQQKNGQVDGVNSMQPTSPNALGFQDQSTQPVKNQPSMLGYVGSAMDKPNQLGGYDPSLITQLNQEIMKQIGQQNPTQQQLPWQQPQSQQQGQNSSLGGLMKILSSFI